MALRLLEAIVPDDCVEPIVAAFDSDAYPQVLETWSYSIDEGRTCIKAVLDAETTEGVTDALSKHCGGQAGFRLTLQPVEATLPRVEEPEKAEMDEAPEAEPLRIGRISREELHADIADSARLTIPFLILAALSSVVAVIGLTRDSVAIIIGAMVIAPLLGPNAALALATALADGPLALRSLRSLSAGLGLALAVAVVAGWLLSPAPDGPEIAARTAAGWGDIVLAAAAGAAGSLTYTLAVPNALVGVMVAVALLPAWVTFGMLLGAGHVQPALGALLLTAINLICLNLTGVVTFVAQGVSPAKWWEARRARRMSLYAIVAWSGLLALLAVLGVIARIGRS